MPIQYVQQESIGLSVFDLAVELDSNQPNHQQYAEIIHHDADTKHDGEQDEFVEFPKQNLLRVVKVIRYVSHISCLSVELFQCDDF